MDARLVLLRQPYPTTQFQRAKIRYILMTIYRTGWFMLPRHYGLYFTEEHVQLADKSREREPFQMAWNFLTQQQPKSELAKAQLAALRYRFESDFYAGEQ